MYLNFDKLNHLFGGRNNYKDADVSEYEQSQKEFFDKLEGIKQEYTDKINSDYQSVQDTLPEDPGYEYISYTGPTKEEIISDTTSAYYNAFKQEAEQLEREFNTDKNALVLSKNDLSEKAEAEKEGARESSEEEKKSAQTSLAANGMGRSSVYELTSEAYDDALSRTLGEIDSAYRDSVAATDEKIAQLQSKYESAFKKADIQNALELYTQIEKLDRQRRSEEQAVEKYNNDITKKTLDYKEDRRKAIADEYEALQKKLQEEREYEEANGDYRGEKKENYQARLNAAIDYYNGISDSDARAKLISDNSGKLKTYLGFYFQKLLDNFDIEL